MTAPKKADDDELALEQLNAVLERLQPLAVEARTAYERRLESEQNIRVTDLEKLKIRLPVDEKVVRRRDWIGVGLSGFLIAGALALAVLLIIRDHIPEALQVFSLIVGWFAGRASRNGVDTPSRGGQ